MSTDAWLDERIDAQLGNLINKCNNGWAKNKDKSVEDGGMHK